MPHPKKQKTHSKTHMGRAHLALKKTTLNKCPKCGSALRPHIACSECGFYKGREVEKKELKSVKKTK
jgi:large subunit ribosomal protein L32